MALAIRPIPTLAGEDAERFNNMAEEAEKHPHTVELKISHEEARKMFAQAFEED
jgi:hypothetical protein